MTRLMAGEMTLSNTGVVEASRKRGFRNILCIVVLSLMGIAMSGCIGRSGSIQVVSRRDFLLTNTFKGSLLLQPLNAEGKSAPNLDSVENLTSTSKNVSLELRDGKNKTYQLTIGKDVIRGEWNDNAGFINLWVDDFNNARFTPRGTALIFRLPRYADEAFVIQPLWDETKVSRWVLLIRNQTNEEYIRLADGSHMAPSRVKIAD